MIMLTDGKNMTNFDKVGDANWRIAEASNVFLLLVPPMA